MLDKLKKLFGANPKATLAAAPKPIKPAKAEAPAVEKPVGKKAATKSTAKKPGRPKKAPEA